MAVKFEDYYQTLGVKRDAAQDEIQRAFRKLARQYHPDVNKDPAAQTKFAKINEAYEVLKDPEKRKKYDQLGQNWKSGQDFRPPPGWENVHFDFSGPGGRSGGFSPEGFSDFFEMFFGRGGAGGGPGGAAGGAGAGPRGFEEVFGRRGTGPGGGFEEVFGGNARAGRGAGAPAEQEAELQLTLEEAYHGGSRRLELQSPEGRKTVDVRIPAGITDGAKIRLRGEGLVLKVKIQPHPRFKVHGHDLTTEVKVAPWEAALGGKADVQTLDGAITLTLPPGAQSGQKLRLKGKGLPKRGGNDERGDLLVRVMIAVPKNVTDQQRELWEKLRDASDFNPRSG